MANPAHTPHRDPHHDVAMPWATGFVVLGLVLMVALTLRVLLQ